MNLLVEPCWARGLILIRNNPINIILKYISSSSSLAKFWFYFSLTFGLQSLVPVTAALCIITSILIGSWVPELVQIVHSYSVSEPSPRLWSSAILTSSVAITWGFHCHALQSGVCVQCEAQCCQVESGLYLGPKQFCNTVSYSGHSIFDFWSKDSQLIKVEVKLILGGVRE